MPAKKSKKIRAVGYCRVSSKKQAEGLSIGLQQDQIARHCEAKGWNLVQTYVDDGYSAKNLRRPEIQRLIEDLDRGRFDVIVISRVDRLARSLRELLRFVRRRLEPAGIRLVSIAEDIDTGDPGSKTQQVLTLMGITSELERQVIRERVIPAVQAAAKNGRVGTHRRYGYQVDAEGKVVIDRAEAKMVPRMFKWAAEDGASIAKITRDLHAEGVDLTRDQVRHILHNRFYLGELSYNKTTRGDDGSKRAVPKKEWLVIEDHHPAIIDADLFDQVQRALKGRYQGSGRRGAGLERLLASDITYCAECGSHIGCGHFSWSGPERKRVPCYFCVRRKSLGADVCDFKPIKQAELELAFLGRLDRWFDRPAVRRACRAAARSAKKDYEQDAQRIALIEQIESVRTKIRRFDELAEAGQLAEVQFSARDDLNHELAELTERLESLTPTEMARWASQLAAYKGKLSELITALEPPDRQALIRNLVQHVEVGLGPEITRVTFHDPFSKWEKGSARKK
jgi:site-specific DNA recombinase